jgi:hypothetical protein
MFVNLPIKTKLSLLALIVFIFSSASHQKSTFAQGASCGNGICQQSGGNTEDCNSCPTDCGTCTTPTPIPQPTSTTAPSGQPTLTIIPSGQPTPTSGVETSSDDSSVQAQQISITLNQASGTIVNTPDITLSGSATTTEGIITGIEYSFDSGDNWSSMASTDGSYDQSTESFQTFLSGLEDGILSIKFRASNNFGNSSESSELQFTIAAIPPEITIDPVSSDPISSNEITISGTVSFGNTIPPATQLSIDGGENWVSLNLVSGRFSYTLEGLEDNNYQLLVRSIDSAGNIGLSDTIEVVVDTLPPIIGGVSASIGPVYLSAKDGVLYTLPNVNINVALSTKGGVNKLSLDSESKSFEFQKIPGKSLFKGQLSFPNPGKYQAIIKAQDGAKNETEKELPNIIVNESGIISNSDDNPVGGVTVSAYHYDNNTNTWNLWTANTYGQVNPQVTNKNGEYGFIVPSGKYYLEINSDHLQKTYSEIFETDSTTLINFNFRLENKKIFPFSLIGSTQIIEKKKSTFKIESSSFNSNEWEFEDLEGNKVSINSTRGVKTLITFISPWSLQSIEQASLLSGINSRLENDEQVYVVLLQENPATTNNFILRGNYKFNTLIDSTGENSNNLGVSLIPHHIFVESNGEIKLVLNTILTQDEIIQEFINLE